MGNTIKRRTVLVATGVAMGSLSGCLGSASDSGQEGCVPPGQYDCPDGELLAVHEFDGCSVEQVEGDCAITVEVTESEGEGEDCDAYSFGWTVDDDCVVYSVRVYGGSDCEDYDYGDGETEGFIETNLEAGQSGQQAGISNIRFCGELEEDENGDDGDEEDGGDGDDGSDGGDGGDGEDGDNGGDGDDGDDGGDGEDGDNGNDDGDSDDSGDDTDDPDGKSKKEKRKEEAEEQSKTQRNCE